MTETTTLSLAWLRAPARTLALAALLAALPASRVQAEEYRKGAQWEEEGEEAEEEDRGDWGRYRERMKERRERRFGGSQGGGGGSGEGGAQAFGGGGGGGGGPFGGRFGGWGGEPGRFERREEVIRKFRKMPAEREDEDEDDDNDDRERPANPMGRILGKLREIDPELAKEIETLAEGKPEKFRHHVMMKIGGQVKGHMHEIGMIMKKGGPEAEQLKKLIGLELRSVVMGFKIQEGTVDGKTAEPELRKILEEAFDQKLALQESRMKEMESKLGELKKTVDERRKKKKDIVQNRLDELSGRETGFRW